MLWDWIFIAIVLSWLIISKSFLCSASFRSCSRSLFSWIWASSPFLNLSQLFDFWTISSVSVSLLVFSRYGCDRVRRGKIYDENWWVVDTVVPLFVLNLLLERLGKHWSRVFHTNLVADVSHVVFLYALLEIVDHLLFVLIVID